MPAPQYWDLLRGYAEAHHGVVSVRIAAKLGVEGRQLYRLTDTGRLVKVARETFVVAGSPPTWHQQVMVASLSTRGVASHRCAAKLWNVNGFQRPAVDILTPHARHRARSGWNVYRTRQFTEVDLTIIEGIPCTALVRTVIDLAAVATPPLLAEALDDVCRRLPNGLEVFTVRFLELTRPGRRGSKVIRELLAERHGQERFAQSGFEAAARKLLRTAGLPDPIPQHVVVLEGGIVVFLDLAWPDIRLAVECDSLAWQTGKRAHEWDRQRRRLLQRAGWEVIPVTYDDITKRPAEIAEEIRYLYIKRSKAVL